MAQALSPPSPAAAAIAPRKLSLSAAVDQWSETTLAMEGLKGLRDEAAKVILEHAQRTGKRTYKDRIAVNETGGSLVLDQAAVREHLGARLSEFMTRSKRGLALKLLK